MTGISGLIGTQWPWSNSPQWIEDSDVIDQAIEDVFFTSIDSRKMNLRHGSDIVKLVFENKGMLLHSLARREISIAIAEHLPFLELLNIDVSEGEKDTDPVTITVDYRYQGIAGTTSLPVQTP